MEDIYFHPNDDYLTDHELAFNQTTPVYPSVYWAANPGRPRIRINPGGAALSYHIVTLMLSDQSWNDTTVSTFMVNVIRENDDVFSSLIPDPWIADGRNISDANAVVTPLSVLEIEEELSPPQPPTNRTGGSKQQRLSRFYALLLLYRKTISRRFNEQYGAELALRLNSYFQTNLFNIASNDIAELTWYIGKVPMTGNYMKINCAVDMFFFKIPKAKYSSLRMATFPTRYRGCFAITALKQIARLTEFTPRNILLFVLTKQVAKDVANIAKSGEGAGDQYGYFPYHVEMGLTTKSAYSMSVNPTLCLWLHTIGSVMGYAGSLIARMPEAWDVGETFIAGAAVGLYLGGGTSAEAAVRLERHIAGINWLTEVEMGNERHAVKLDTPPQLLPEQTLLGISVTNVLTGLLQNKGLSEEQIKVLTARANNCRTLPERTVGAFFYRAYGS